MHRRLTSEFVEKLLGRVRDKQVRIVVVNHHRYSFRVKGKEMGYIDRREAQIHLGGDTYTPENEETAKALHLQVAVDQGHKFE